MRAILLAGASASGKTTLARAVAASGNRFLLSTSAHLRSVTGISDNSQLYQAGVKLDRDNPWWLHQLVNRDMANTPVVVDAVRSHEQHCRFMDVVRVNVVAGDDAMGVRHLERGTREPIPNTYLFNRPDFVWDSCRMSLATAVAAISQISGGGYVDTIVGGQYGSEGKGKLAALLAPKYDLLLRSGGPNAGHWVRTDSYEFCFHHLPSGTLANRNAQVVIAAGAAIYPPTFWTEVERTECMDRLHIDSNAVIISNMDREGEDSLVKEIGSTSQGVGLAQSRRVLRGHGTYPFAPPETAKDDKVFGSMTHNMSDYVNGCVRMGKRVLAEGTQGSGLSLYHGPYPFTTSRDTNVSGLLSESGIAPSLVRDSWMVIRSLPIRVGGNSGPMEREITWEEVARRTNQGPDTLKAKELTSTTKRQRRVGEFSWNDFQKAVQVNQPTKLFLSFADYINPAAAGIRDFGRLPDDVLSFVRDLEERSAVPVVGISTGRMQDDVCLRSAFHAT